MQPGLFLKACSELFERLTLTNIYLGKITIPLPSGHNSQQRGRNTDGTVEPSNRLLLNIVYFLFTVDRSF